MSSANPPEITPLPTSAPVSTLTAYQIQTGPTVGRVLRRSVAILFFVLILITTPCAFWVYSLNSVALNQDTYKAAINNQSFYASILPGLTTAIADSQAKDRSPGLQKNLQILNEHLSDDDWRQISERVLPTGWLQRNLDNNITQGFDWLNGAGVLPQFYFDLAQLQSTLTKENVRTAVDIIVPKMPACTLDQLQQARKANPSKPDGMAGFLICNPESEADQTMMIDKITTLIAAAGTSIPDHIDFQEEFFKANPTTPEQLKVETQFNMFRSQIALMNRLLLLLFLVPLGLFSLIIILTIRSSKAFFRWIGWACILSGILTAIPLPLVSGLMSAANLKNAIAQGPGEQNPLFTSLFLGIASSISGRLTTILIVAAGVILLVGFVSLIVSVLVAAPEPEIRAQIVTVTPPSST